MSDAPRATYRLQLTPSFDFRAAAAVVPYLAELGVSHVYCSPILEAASGSQHGYDVVDPGVLRGELGGEDGFATLVEACHHHGLGLVVDVVPNHMYVGPPEQANAAWSDVLQRGRSSPFAKWFDIDWAAPGIEEKVSADDPVVDVDGELRRYRRFFGISSLAGVRVEDPEVFGATHRLIAELTRRGIVNGLRIDHPDGLFDPAGYLEALAEVTDGVWTVVEKILEVDEQLPDDWRCAGTTGYDALNAVNGLFVDRDAEGAFTQIYAEFTGDRTGWDDVVRRAKREILDRVLAPEVARLSRLVAQELAEPQPAVADALRALLVAMPVYRIYVRPDREPTEAARSLLTTVATEAARHVDPETAKLVERIRELLLTGPAEIVTRFQQTSGPAMAKGVEDTAFYRYHRLTSLCEVGGDPARFGRSVEEFHAFCQQLISDTPATMTTLSTHDTKRSEDVRARINVLTELPDEWHAAVSEWSAAAAHHWRGAAPDRNVEYLFWQTLVGAWPIDVDRLTAYVEKAAREAGERTAWVDGDPAYDEALRDFTRSVLADATLTTAVDGFVNRLTAAATANSLGQKLVQLTMPGVPDIYQGCELVDLSLVDPDNRRPVDFTSRAQHLAAGSDDKLRVVSAALLLRKEHPEWFGGPASSYRPLPASGPAVAHLIAFVRGESAVTVSTRLSLRLQTDGGWSDTTVELPAGEWINVISGQQHPGGVHRVADLLSRFPVALMGKT